MAAAADPDMWTGRGDRRFNVLGRLKPGLTLSQAQSSVSLIVNRLTQQFPATDKGITVSVVSEPLSHPVPLPGNITAIAAGLFLCLAALVLLLAGVNVVNLLLVRATAQEGEMSIRAALGSQPQSFDQSGAERKRLAGHARRGRRNRARNTSHAMDL
jgi:putative ABC transport system permease protein